MNNIIKISLIFFISIVSFSCQKEDFQKDTVDEPIQNKGDSLALKSSNPNFIQDLEGTWVNMYLPYKSGKNFLSGSHISNTVDLNYYDSERQVWKIDRSNSGKIGGAYYSIMKNGNPKKGPYLGRTNTSLSDPGEPAMCPAAFCDFSFEAIPGTDLYKIYVEYSTGKFGSIQRAYLTAGSDFYLYFTPNTVGKGNLQSWRIQPALW